MLSSKRFLFFVLVGLVLPLWIGCDQKSDDVSTGIDRLVDFKGRTIDLQPYVEGFPYRSFTPVINANKMYYVQVGDTDQLKEIALDKEGSDLAEGRVLSDIDFSKRNVWGIRYREKDQKLYWIGDEQNDEVINLFRLDPEDGVLAKLTDVPYIFGWRWNPEETEVAYVARLGDKEQRLGELRVLNLETGEERVLLQDAPEMRFSWGDPSWQPEGEGVVFNALSNADRTYANLVYVPLKDTPDQAILLTDAEQARQFPLVLEEWLNENEFVFLSNESGYLNLYRYNIRTKEQTAITAFEEDLRSVELSEIDGKKQIVAIIHRPAENELLLIDPVSGTVSLREVIDKNLNFMDEDGGQLLVYATSASTPFEINELHLMGDRFQMREFITLPQTLRDQIVHCEVERISYPTFDVDPATDTTRMLHAFLYQPKDPLPPDEQLAMITSFYGGGNSFSKQTQILCHAGIYVFSPAPRGSFGFGKAFAALNDKDLGGNEILDIIYAGRYINERLGIAPNRIGPYGGSHGGYATMRLLTFPGEINGNQADFDWGFGISHAGFSDITRFYEMSNIPDWVTLEAGDPKTDRDKLLDRSPITHADKLKGPLLLTHGENDNRVHVVESRTMAARLDSLGQPVRYVEFEGQGHGVKGLENTVQYYRVWFEFLASLDELQESDRARVLPMTESTR